MTKETVKPQARSDARLRAIGAITDRGLQQLDVDDLLVELLARLSELLHVDTAAVLLLDQAARFLVARAAHGIAEEVHQGVRIAVGRGFAGRIAAERRPITLNRIDATTVENPLLWEKGIQSMLGVPLQSGSRLLGVLHVGTVTDRVFTLADTELLELAAERVTASVQARELENERSAGRLLQRSLLPAALPELREISFATRYVPAAEGGVGGDWYDAFVLPSGELWLMTGDVAGHGLNAALIMGRLRASLRSYALEGDAPEKILAQADRKLQFFEPDQMATVLCGLLRPPYDTIRLATAGHPPPVLALPGEASTLVEMPVAPPFGVVDRLAPEAVTVELPPGAAFVTYTDGLIERRGESLDAGLQRLVAAVKAKEPEYLCRDIMELLIGNEVPRDDVAVLAMRRNE